MVKLRSYPCESTNRPGMVNPEMLLRYYQGKCSKEECRLVGEWFESCEEIPDSFADSEAEQMEERIWSRIKDRSLKVVPTGSPSPFYFMAAACASILLMGFLSFWPAAKPTASARNIVKLKDGQKELNTGLLATALGDSSSAQVQLSDGDKAGAVSFCGVIRISNNSRKSREYIFESACQSTTYTHKRVVLKPGKTYIALHNYYKTHEVIVLSEEQMQQLPDAFSPEIQRELNI